MKLFLRALLLGVVAAALAAPFASGQDPNPYANYTCAPTPEDCRGWRSTDVTLRWWLVPAPEIQETRDCGVVPVANEGVNRHTCQVRANGQWWFETAEIKVDKTAPQTPAGTASRPPDANGWYRDAVRIDFASTDAKPGVEVSGIASCTSVPFAGPDTGGTTVTGTCHDNAGNTSAVGSFALKFDATPPAVATVEPTRRPDHGPWYTRPVAFTVTGEDATSGLAGCDPLVHDGPDSESSVVQATCRDHAGNVGARGVTIAYDDSAPALRKVKVRPGDGVVRLNWAAADASKVRIVRSPGRGGDERTEVHDGGGTRFVDTHVRNGRRYEYRFAAVDQAGNESDRTVGVVPGPRLLSPKDGAHVDAPPVLRWTRVRGADYYNVQLWRGDRKILSTWPSKARLKLRRKWRFLGKRRLEAGGHYRWLVWPGEGPRELNDYGRLIGRRAFVFAPNT